MKRKSLIADDQIPASYSAGKKCLISSAPSGPGASSSPSGSGKPANPFVSVKVQKTAIENTGIFSSPLVRSLDSPDQFQRSKSDSSLATGVNFDSLRSSARARPFPLSTSSLSEEVNLTGADTMLAPTSFIPSAPPPSSTWHNKIPIDWGLKAKLQFLSKVPFDWVEGASSSCSLLQSEYAKASEYYIHPNVPQGMQHPSVPQGLLDRCARAIAAPEKLRSAVEKEEFQFAANRKREWLEAFNSLTSQLLTMTSSSLFYFYAQFQEFNLLFRNRGMMSNDDVIDLSCYVSHSSRVFRQRLRENDVNFEMPMTFEIRSSISDADRAELLKLEKIIPSLIKTDSEKESNSADNTAASLLITRGNRAVSVLCDFLRKIGPQQMDEGHDVPKLICPFSFLNSTLKRLQISFNSKTYRAASSSATQNSNSMLGLSNGSSLTTEQIYRLDLEGPILPDRFLHLCQTISKLQQQQRKKSADSEISQNFQNPTSASSTSASPASSSSSSSSSLLGSRRFSESNNNNNSLLSFSSASNQFEEESCATPLSSSNVTTSLITELEILCHYPPASVHNFNYQPEEENRRKEKAEVTNTTTEVSLNFLDRLKNESSVLGMSVIHRLKECVNPIDGNRMYQLSNK